MDHKFAEAEMSVEKYTLNELSPDERTQFEEHLFDCPICSDLVRQNFNITENLKEVLSEEQQARGSAPRDAVHRNWWRAWLTIPSLVPTAVALILGVFLFFHNPGTEPMMIAQVVLPLATLRPASRGTALVVHIDHASPVSVFKVIIDKLSGGAFEGELDNLQGRKLLTVPRAVKADNSVELEFPSQALVAGRYQLKLHSDSQLDDIQTYAFEVK